MAGERAADAFSRDYNLTPEVTRDFFQGDFLDCLIGKRDLKQALEPILAKWGWLGTVNDYIDYWFKVESTPDYALLSDIASRRASGVPCSLATNQEKYRTEYIAQVMGLANHFDGIFASAHVGYLKPDKRFYEQVLKTLAPVSPGDILFFDDSARNVDGAQQTGMQAELYTSFSGYRRVMAERGIGIN